MCAGKTELPKSVCVELIVADFPFTISILIFKIVYNLGDWF